MAKYHKTRSRARGNSRKSIRKRVYSLAESLAREGIQQKFQDTLEAERDEICPTHGKGFLRCPDGCKGPLSWPTDAVLDLLRRDLRV
jgi:hypothetical protein